MYLYNALTQEKERFTLHNDEATIYVCGVTPYDTTHLGHSFTYCSFDVLIRYLEYRGIPVRYVQNVTDIDDDILDKADVVEGDWREVGDRWTRHFVEDMKALNVRPPDHFPRATDVIDEMIEVVAALLENGLAYEENGSVYFHVDSWEDFGALSRIPRSEMLPIANERGNNPDDPNKKDPLDFVLWQTQAPGEPAWKSPWGKGRPGWHIECSTMATEYLGDVIDIHGGGADLIFPHHECEIAQAEGATGRSPFSRFWLHTAMVRYEGEKMSKSLGNLIMVRNLLEAGWTPDAIRLYMAQHHYREPWAFQEATLEQAAQTGESLSDALQASAVAAAGDGERLDPQGAVNDFATAMDDDLDTATAITALTQLGDEIRDAAAAGQEVRSAQAELRQMASVLGLTFNQGRPETQVSSGWDRHLERF